MFRQTGSSDPDLTALLATMLLAASLALGGGGSPAPLLEIVLQGLAALVAALWLLGGNGLAAWRRVPVGVQWIAGLALLIPVLQLIPLPSGLWQALPGRDGERAALDLLGAVDTWRTLSLSPARTLASLLVMLAASLSLVMTASLPVEARARLLGVLAAMGGVTLLLGTAQLSGGAGNPFRIFSLEQNFLTGFQANHNSTADVMLTAILAGAAVTRNWLDRGLVNLSFWRLAGAVLSIEGVMVLGLYLTASRAGMMLLPVVLGFQFLILKGTARLRLGRLAAGGLASSALAALAVFALRGNREIAAVAARFNFAGEFRPELWRDSLYALGQTWPAGAGMGSFVPVFMAVERLEVVDPTLPNRAHNDFLELAIESGLPGILALLAIIGLILAAAWRALRRPGDAARGQVLFAIGTLVVLALHSLVDYPLRSMALAAIAATAVGLLFPARQVEHTQSKGSVS